MRLDTDAWMPYPRYAYGWYNHEGRCYALPMNTRSWPSELKEEYINRHAWTWNPDICRYEINPDRDEGAQKEKKIDEIIDRNLGRLQNGHSYSYGNRLCEFGGIKKVIVNGPATIVFWHDGTKTVVYRSEKTGDNDDIYSAVAQALTKKVYLSTNHFHKIVNEKTVYQKRKKV